MVNQRGPTGTLQYKQIGTFPDGSPRYEAVTTLTPEEQAIQRLNTQTRTNVGNIGVEQSARIGELLNSPIDLSNDAVEGRLFELGSKRLDPMFDRRRSDLQSDLINRGIRPGSPEYVREMQALGQESNDAYDQLFLTGRGQAVQEMLAQRNQPINEISALMSGSQVSQPNFMSTPQTPVSGVDYAGLVSNAYNQEVGQYNAMMGGLFGLGGTAASALAKNPAMLALSDRRLKTIIARVGTADNGLPLYLFRYNSEDDEAEPRLGVMADEVEQLRPEAVSLTPAGFKAVDYARALA